jgi:cytochrome P450
VSRENGTHTLPRSCIDARFASSAPLSPSQKRAHVTLLIQAGADTTGTALGSILRFLLTHPPSLARARAEIASAEHANLLSTPIQFEETRQHLPFFVACIKEGLRLHPPAPNLFARVVPPGGKRIDGHNIPAGTDVTSHAYVVQRDAATYGRDADAFAPERWLQSEARSFALEAASFTFGAGARVCLGRDVAVLEMYKLLPEVRLACFSFLRIRSGEGALTVA